MPWKRHLLLLPIMGALAVFSGCGGSSGVSEEGMAMMLEEQVPKVHDVTCVKTESSERKFYCNAVSEEDAENIEQGIGGGPIGAPPPPPQTTARITLNVTVSESGSHYFVNNCEGVEEVEFDPCAEIG